MPKRDRALARAISADPALGDPTVGRLTAVEVERAWGAADKYTPAQLEGLRRLSRRLGVEVPRAAPAESCLGQVPVDPATGRPRRATRIINTLGPATQSVQVLADMIRSGMDVARINFSHVRTLEEARQTVDALASAMELAGRRVLLLADLQGPKIRVGALAAPIVVTTGSRVALVAANQSAAPPSGAVPLHPPEILADLCVGDRVFIDDGKICLRVASKEGDCISADVLQGGEVRSRKGLNFPDSTLKQRVPTANDLESLAIINSLRIGERPAFDLVAVSFVEHGDDMARVRAALRIPAKLVAKVERPVALEAANLRSIFAASDAVMVARGDLAVELGYADVPHVANRLLAMGRRLGVPTGIATEMLESMTELKPPTRAEVHDVAASVLDGAAFVMTSGETATGKQPVEVVRTMANIVETAERAKRTGTARANGR